MAKTGDKLLIGGAILAGLAAIMWYGDKLVKDASNSFAKGITLPSFSPSVTLPNVNVTLPNINLGITNWTDQAGKIAEAAATGVASVLPGGLAIAGMLGQGNQTPAYTGPTQPASSTRLSSNNTNASRKADIEKNGIGALFSSNPLQPTQNSQPANGSLFSNSVGGGGIWVPDPKVQGGGYYIADNSLYGGSSGMPAPSTPTVPSAPQTFEGKAYSTRGYTGTVGGYHDYLNSQQPGQGDSWLTKAKLNPAGYGIL